MRTFSVLICSIALACAASGQVTSTGGGGVAAGAGAQEKNKSKKPAPTKEEPQGTILDPKLKSAQAVTAGGGPQEGVDTRQLLMQTQHDPMGAGAAQKTKGKAKGAQQVATRGGQAEGSWGQIHDPNKRYQVLVAGLGWINQR